MPFNSLDELRAAVDLMRSVFPIVRTYLCSIPIYPGVLWSFTAASTTIDPTQVTAEAIARRLQRNNYPTGWYTPAVHQAAFALPNYLSATLGRQTPDAPTALPVPISE